MTTAVEPQRNQQSAVSDLLSQIIKPVVVRPANTFGVGLFDPDTGEQRFVIARNEPAEAVQAATDLQDYLRRVIKKAVSL